MTAITDVVSGWPCVSYIVGCRESRKLVLIIVAIAVHEYPHTPSFVFFYFLFLQLFLDNMLLTTVVPIIPEFLYNIRHREDGFTYDTFESAQQQQQQQQQLSTQGGEGMGVATSTITTPFEMFTAQSDNMSMTMTSSMSSTATLPTTTAPMTTSATTNATRLPRKTKHEELNDETVEVGIMFASKAFVQLLANPFVGPLTSRIGYSIPMFIGFVIMFFSTIIFAFGRSYRVLFLARALQGIGSSCSSVSGMGMLAERFPEDKERGNAMGLALGGLALGVLFGPPFGGIMYQFFGKTVPFLILALLALGDGFLQLLVLQPAVVRQEAEAPSLKSLLSDPYILVTLGAITFANMGIAMLEPSLPIHMMDTMNAPKWQLGAAFLPASISYLIGTNLFGPLGHKIGRWLAAMIGLIVVGICLICIPLATNINHLIAPNAGLGFAIGMVDSSMMPELGYLVDIRHAAVYGSVYAIGDVAFCLGFAIGPAFSGTLVKTIGFEWMLIGIAMINFMYAPALFMLRSPPTKEEERDLILGQKSSVKYVNYRDEEEEDGGGRE